MAHTETFDVTKPADTELEGKGDDYIRQILLDLKERLALDHNMNDILDTTLPTADGYHSKLTFRELTSDPSLLTTTKGTCTISNATPAVVTLSTHGLVTGNIVYFTTTGGLPSPLAVSTAYYVVYIDANTFSLATTHANAVAGTKIATTTAGSGTHTLIKDNGSAILYAKSTGVYFRNPAGIVKVI